MKFNQKELIKWIKLHWKNHEVQWIDITIRGKGTRERLEMDKGYMEDKK